MISEKTEPRVLVVSHVAFDLQNNMGRTLENLFCSWKPENIAQFYLYSKAPNSEICSNFFRVTDFDVLKTVLPIKNQKQPAAEFSDTTDAQKNVYNFARSRKPYQYIGRNFIWKIGKWYSEDLKNWILKFKPDAVFYAAGGYSFSYIIAERIAGDFNIPLIPYFCDDYYFLNMYPNSALYKHVRNDIRRTIKEVIENSPAYICISDEMEKAYGAEFGIPGTVIMNGAVEVQELADDGRENFSGENPFVIRYLGRLGLGRADALIELGRFIKESELPVKLQVFSTETSEKLLSGMNEENGIDFMGAVSSDEIVDTMRQADALLHVESDDPQMVERTKYSVSTKIPDMLASGVCSIAVGPENLASIKYLKDIDAAYILNLKSIKKSDVEQMFSAKSRTVKIKNAAKAAELNHNAILNSERLKQEICKALKR